MRSSQVITMLRAQLEQCNEERQDLLQRLVAKSHAEYLAAVDKTPGFPEVEVPLYYATDPTGLEVVPVYHDDNEASDQ